MKNKKIIIITIVALLIDQITKLIIRTNFNLLDTKTVINNFFYLTYMKNTGAAFSSFTNNTLFLIIIGIISLIFLIMYLKKAKLNRLSSISYAIILAGIIGNLIDRVFLNGVVDFLSFKIFNYYFPVFNIADTYIVIGVIVLLIDSLGSDYNEYKRSNSRRR